MPKTDQGVTNDRYSIIPRTLIFVTRPGAVLLIKGAPTKRLWANKYNGLGGHIERGEDALTAARRELLEETGLAGVPLRLAGTVMIDAGAQHGIGLFVYVGEYESGELIASHEGTLEWVAWDQCDNMPLVEDLRPMLSKIRAVRPGEAPFSARYTYDEGDNLVITYVD